MSKAFIDTDVILDFMIAGESFVMDAARIFTLSEKKQISICTTGLVFSNAYYIDALQHYAALSENVKMIITRNTKDYKNSELAVLTPDQFLKGRN